MSNPASVPASDPGSYGVCIAFGQNAYTLTPAWTRLDDPTAPVFGHKSASPHDCNCASAWTVDRGRTYELDKTQAGTATVTLQDPNGLFDPTNTASPFFGKINPMLRGKISMQNPSNGLFYDIFTGFVESWSWTMDQMEQIMTVTVSMTDGFEPLTRAELPVEASGVTLLPGLQSTDACQLRINGFLDAAQWPDDGLPGPDSSWRNINSGNVFLNQTSYDPETQILSCIQDTCDAEFPGVANFFMNKRGAATFYGRYPRFQPTNFPDDVNVWQVSDVGGESAAGTGTAKINLMTWAMDSTNLINYCLSYPYGIAQKDIINQIAVDTGSVSLYGPRALSLTDLMCFGQPAGGGSTPAQAAQPYNQLGANAVAFYYAQYYVANYAKPALRISSLQFTSRPPGDSQSWQFLTGVEIGDLLSVWTTNPGGGGFGKDAFVSTPAEFFVEGLHYQTNGPLQIGIPDISLSVDSSPRDWFTTMTWT